MGDEAASPDALGELKAGLAQVRADLIMRAHVNDLNDRTERFERRIKAMEKSVAGHWVTSFGFFLLISVLSLFVALAWGTCLWLTHLPPGRAADGAAIGSFGAGTIAALGLAAVLFIRWDHESGGRP